MKALTCCLMSLLLSVSLNAKDLKSIEAEVQGEFNKLRVMGIAIVGTQEYQKLVGEEYDEELKIGYVPDTALISAIHYADVTTLKAGKSPNEKITAAEIIEKYKPEGPKEDYEIIGSYFDALDPDFDASSYRRLAAVLAGGLTQEQTTKLAENLEKQGQPGKIHYNHIYRAIQDSVKQ